MNTQPTLRCCRCKAIQFDAGPDAPISDGICKACWPLFRAELGLREKPYPVAA